MTLAWKGQSVPWTPAAIVTAIMLAAQPASAQTMERVAVSGLFEIGFREDAPPFSFRDEDGVPSGFAIELCREVAADLKIALGLDDLAIEYVPVSTEDRFQAVADGRVDIHCGASTITLERRQTVSFSIPTFHTGISPLMRADAPRSLQDTLAARQPTLPPRAALIQAFTNRTFGVRADTTAEDWLSASIDTLAANADMVTVDSHDEGLRQVADGTLDAYFADQSILLGLVARSADPGVFVIGERTYTHEPYGLALAKGDEEFRLLVDRSLSRVYRSLEFAPIFTRYFGRPARSVISVYLMTALPE